LIEKLGDIVRGIRQGQSGIVSSILLSAVAGIVIEPIGRLRANVYPCGSRIPDPQRPEKIVKDYNGRNVSFKFRTLKLLKDQVVKGIDDINVVLSLPAKANELHLLMFVHGDIPNWKQRILHFMEILTTDGSKHLYFLRNCFAHANCVIRGNPRYPLEEGTLTMWNIHKNAVQIFQINVLALITWLRGYFIIIKERFRTLPRPAADAKVVYK
jgi:hypothetical protein